MIAGHFGLAAIVKSRAPSVPLWALMLGCQFLDVVFVPLVVAEVVQTSIGGSSWRALGALSPAYPAGMRHFSNDLLLDAGVVAALGYLVVGVALIVAMWLAVHRRSARREIISRL